MVWVECGEFRAADREERERASRVGREEAEEASAFLS